MVQKASRQAGDDVLSIFEDSEGDEFSGFSPVSDNVKAKKQNKNRQR